MNEQSSQKSQLKRYFARRVTNQVRLILGLWRQLNDELWAQERFDDLLRAIQTLIRFAQHFNEEEHRRTAKEMLYYLEIVDESNQPPKPEMLNKMTHLIQMLGELALRRNDQSIAKNPSIGPKKPVYLAFASIEAGVLMAEQLEFFGFRVLLTASEAEFRAEMDSRLPAAIIMDVQFGDKPSLDDQGVPSGLRILEETLATSDHLIHSVIFSSEPADIFMRLIATRVGCAYFHQDQLELGRLVEQLDEITQMSPPSPFRVLIVDDSKSQGAATQKALNQGGLIAEHILDPLLVLDAIEQHDPEIILLDMYMPACKGTELAQVIRQFEIYHHIPIVFLSAEDDPEKQALMMSSGADDFLNKSLDPKHLLAEVKARGYRARTIVELMYRDSLTGLLNHSRIMRALKIEIEKALISGQPLCYAMVDIDHFKSVNDTYGHAEGDRVIKRLAMFLKQRLRKTDTVGRYGGEEFAVVLPNTTAEDARIFLNDIRDHYSKFRYTTKNGEFSSTVSAGIALLTANNAEMINVQADEALYDAKRGGRNRVCIYSTKS